MDVASWLRSLGLEKYEALFRENEIDADVLPELTELDLEKLGVLLGHRKRLLEAITTLADRADVAVRSAPHLSRRTWPNAVRAWTPKICAKSFPLIRSASQRPLPGARVNAGSGLPMFQIGYDVGGVHHNDVAVHQDWHLDALIEGFECVMVRPQ